MMYKIPALAFVLLLASCADSYRSLDNLGSIDDFKDQILQPDFEAPEDETVEVQNTCNGFVNTKTSPLNVRVDASLNARVCTQLDSKTTVIISQDGHKNGFLKILTPKCKEVFSYVSKKYIGLGSDCEFSAEEDVAEGVGAKPKEVGHATNSQVNTFFIERKEFTLANGKAGRWDGCKVGYKSGGGYNSDSRCGRAYLHKKFSKNLNEQFYRCIFQAADVAGYPKTQKVFINHLGTYNDRNARKSKRKSNHAYARAMDIKNFNLVDERGKVSKVSTLLRNYKGQQAKFYDEFRDCWKKSMPTSCRAGKTEYKGSIGHRSSKLGGNSLHNDHIHLSFPLCAG